MEIAKILDLSPTGRDADSRGELQGDDRHQQQQQQQQQLQEQHQRLLLQEEMSELSSSLHQIRRDLELAAVNCDEQTKKIGSYSRELDTLQQERLAHVQQLRSLHADINSVEASMKRSEQARQRELARARALMDRYGGLLARVNRLRLLCNLEPLEDCRDCGAAEQVSKHLPLPMPPLLQSQQLHQATPFLPAPTTLDFGGPFLAGFPPFLPPFPPPPLLPPSAFQHPPASLQPPAPPPPPPPLILSTRSESPPLSHDDQRLRCQHVQQRQSGSGSQHQQQLPAAPSFQQQPPPMKACLSCHQQIHRNAPICPLCKAKSRSKHPKKQKRKADD